MIIAATANPTAVTPRESEASSVPWRCGYREAVRIKAAGDCWIARMRGR
jgi:hypothetical protein